MLTKTQLAATDRFVVEDVRCGSHRGSWSAPEESARHAVVFVRAGCFRRRVDGVESLLDPVSVYFERPGQEQQVAHPRDGGDVCTQLVLDERFVDDAFGGELGVPSRPMLTSADVDLAHRLLVRAAHAGDVFDLTERVVTLVARTRARTTGERARLRASTVAARRRAVEGTREAIVADPGAGLLELARTVSVSPHHLSRIFRAETGETITRYRNRVRVRIVLERLGDGERSLARLAAELGFADQAHLARVVRAEVGATPSALRRLLAA